ncbi:MAG TPA: hypothetical protein VIH35_04525, partial [Kiritimatiellia bacterium]
VERFFGQRMKKMEARVTHRELKNVILLRLVLFTNPVLNWALGISGVRYRNMIIGTMIGVLPGVVILTWLSSDLVDFINTGTARSLVKHWQLLIPLVLAMALFRGNWFFDRLEKMHKAPATGEPVP